MFQGHFLKDTAEMPVQETRYRCDDKQGKANARVSRGLDLFFFFYGLWLFCSRTGVLFEEIDSFIYCYFYLQYLNCII